MAKILNAYFSFGGSTTSARSEDIGIGSREDKFKKCNGLNCYYCLGVASPEQPNSYC